MKGGGGGILQGFLFVFLYCRRPKKVRVFIRLLSLAAKSAFIQ